jgi:HPr kinase/phosphorylase
MAQTPAMQNIHASCVAANGMGLLILGPSGAGKSALALQMIALGAQLVADDRCEIWAEHDKLCARAPAEIEGLIEARGLGILRLPFCERIQIKAAVNLSDSSYARLPQPRSLRLLEVEVEFLPFHVAPHFPSALMCYFIGTRSA